MDIFEIRMENFKTQFEAFKSREARKGVPEYGSLKRFCDKADLSPRYMSHVINGRKNIGEDVARRIEVGFRLAHGWMDNFHGESEAAQPNDEEFLHSLLQSAYQLDPTGTKEALLSVIMKAKSSAR